MYGLSIYNWEVSMAVLEIRFMPANIQFLGYNPLPEAKTLAEQLVRQRTALGMSQKEAALKLDVDDGTLARWERGERDQRASSWDAWIGFLPTKVRATRICAASGNAASFNWQRLPFVDNSP
jgi:hypothetical protein